MKKSNKFNGRTINVIDGNVQRALKKFKRMISANNILKQCYEKQYFVKPSTLKRKKNNEKKFKIKCFMINSQENYNQK